MRSLPVVIWNNKFNNPALPPPESFKDQTILITGASGGLGLATAVHFVNLGASSVIITARTQERGEAAKAAIEAQTQSSAGKGVVKAMELDMSTLEGTKQFAERVKREVRTIDYVLLNAGLLDTVYRLGSDGWEDVLQVNVLSTALLGILLLPWMKEVGGRGKGKPHLGFVTSGTHRTVDIGSGSGWPQENVLGFYNKEENWPGGSGQNMYALSKLLEQFVANEIAKLSLGPDGSPQVIVNPMCPGLVKSDLARQHKSGLLISLAIDAFLNLAAKPTEAGARSLVLAALTTPAENGRYVTHYQTDEEYKVLAEKNITGPEGRKMQAEVWREVLEILEQKIPEVKEIVAAAARPAVL